jgi:hypothetical protein
MIHEEDKQAVGSQKSRTQGKLAFEITRRKSDSIDTTVDALCNIRTALSVHQFHAHYSLQTLVVREQCAVAGGRINRMQTDVHRNRYECAAGSAGDASELHGLRQVNCAELRYPQQTNTRDQERRRTILTAIPCCVQYSATSRHKSGSSQVVLNTPLGCSTDLRIWGAAEKATKQGKERAEASERK